MSFEIERYLNQDSFTRLQQTFPEAFSLPIQQRQYPVIIVEEKNPLTALAERDPKLAAECFKYFADRQLDIQREITVRELSRERITSHTEIIRQEHETRRTELRVIEHALTTAVKKLRPSKKASQVRLTKTRGSLFGLVSWEVWTVTLK